MLGTVNALQKPPFYFVEKNFQSHVWTTTMIWMEVHLRIVWEHVNPELTQRKKSSDSDG